MANAVAMPRTQRSPSGNADLILRLLTLWRAAFGTVMVIAAVLLWLTPVGAEMALWVRILATVVTLGMGTASLMAVPAIVQRNHRGRTLSLFVDYLGFVACLLAALQIMRIFLGINALADTFGAGLPYLLIVLGGYLIGALGDRYEDYPQTQRRLSRISKVIMAIGGVIFFFAVSGPKGLLFIGQQMLNPVAASLLFATVIFGVASLGHVAAIQRGRHACQEQPQRDAERLALFVSQFAGLSDLLCRPPAPLPLFQLYQLRRLQSAPLDWL